jgi:proteasome activator subunit 4
MRYPIPPKTLAKLVRLYYELCLLPGIEPQAIYGWADMISRLLCNKSSATRKLEASDLELPWQPLWRVIQKELWPKRRLRNHK